MANLMMNMLKVVLLASILNICVVQSTHFRRRPFRYAVNYRMVINGGGDVLNPDEASTAQTEPSEMNEPQNDANESSAPINQEEPIQPEQMPMPMDQDQMEDSESGEVDMGEDETNSQMVDQLPLDDNRSAQGLPNLSPNGQYSRLFRFRARK